MNSTHTAVEGITPYGFNFNGAWTFGSSKRTDWVGPPEQPGNKCKKDHFKEPPQRELNRPTNLPIDSRFKEIKSQTPPVGNYKISKQLGRYLSNGELDKHPDMPKATAIPDKENPIGPTTYQPKILVGQTQPQFSFGYKEETRWGKDGPAPNTYQDGNAALIKSQTSWRSTKAKSGFGTAPKNVLPKTIPLGPGQYEIKDFHEGPKKSFPKSRRDFFKSDELPGPGAYQQELMKTKTAFSFGGKYVPFKESNYYTPGPGTHNPKLPQSAKNIRIPKDQRRDLVTAEDKVKPGPGQYFDDRNEKYKYEGGRYSEHGFALDLAERPDPNSPEKLSKFRVPSPWKYDAKSSLNGPKFSIRMKNERLNLNANPGPGQYEPDYTEAESNQKIYIETSKSKFERKKHHLYSTGMSQRSDPVFSKFQNVGPGSYEISTAASGTRPSMPKAQRFPVKDNEDVGPGQYTIPGSIGLIPKYHFEKNKDHIDVSKIGKF